jgi:hypothetical protein
MKPTDMTNLRAPLTPTERRTLQRQLANGSREAKRASRVAAIVLLQMNLRSRGGRRP